MLHWKKSWVEYDFLKMEKCIFWIPFVWFLALLGIINIIISYACKWSLQGHFGDNFVFPQSYDAAAKPLKTFVLNLISKSIFDNKNAAIVQKSINYRVSHSEMNYSKWLWELERLRIFLNFGG